MKLKPYPSYKDSGVEWLGKVPSNWTVTKIKHKCSFSTGWTPPTGDDSSYVGNNFWANISDLGTRVIYETSKQISDAAVSKANIPITLKGSLLFSFKLSIGQVSFAGVDMYTNEAIASFPSGQDIDVRYAYYAYPLFIVQNASENIYGAKLLNQDLIKNAEIVVSDLPEQVFIANFLDRETAKLDTLIAKQEKLIDLLQEKRHAIISHAVTKGLNPDAKMKDSGVEWLGEVPEHWDLGRLTKFIGPIVDYRGRTPTKVDEGIFLVTARNIKLGKIDYSASEEYVDAASVESLLERGRPEIGDVLFTMEAPLGQVALIDRLDIGLAQRIESPLVY